jgi:hypothetical protein
MVAPWSLARTVGEWAFRRNAVDPCVALDDHWYLSAGVVDRETYRLLPRNDLRGTNLDASCYADGPLENWTAGALKLNGRDQYLSLLPPAAPAAATPPAAPRTTLTPASFGVLPGPHDLGGNYLVEVFFRTQPGAAGGTLASKISARGWELAIESGGAPGFRLAGDRAVRASGPRPVNDGRWHHAVAEFDRGGDVARLYVDGERAAETAAAGVGSLSNDAPLLVGKGRQGAFFAGEIEFLRVALATLAESKTSIEELYDWEFDGPFLRDFAGRAPAGACRAAGAFEPAP